jgi:hypothetical protein
MTRKEIVMQGDGDEQYLEHHREGMYLQEVCGRLQRLRAIETFRNLNSYTLSSYLLLERCPHLHSPTTHGTML